MSDSRSALIDSLLSRAEKRVFLDVGPYANEAPGWTVLSNREGADYRHDVLDFPWPLPDSSVFYLRAFHIVEHIPHRCADEDGQDPLLMFIDEMHRVLMPGGTIWLNTMHGSTRMATADPTNRRVLFETTFECLTDRFEVTHGFATDEVGTPIEMHVTLVKR